MTRLDIETEIVRMERETSSGADSGEPDVRVATTPAPDSPPLTPEQAMFLYDFERSVH